MVVETRWRWRLHARPSPWCVGDIALRNAPTLVVSAVSDRRMAVLLALLHERAGVSLGVPRVAHTTVQPVAKPT
jgi:hypothetical protein